MKSQEEMSGDISRYSIHMADVASDNYEREFNLDLMSKEKELIAKIDASLKKIEDESFGLCVKCEGPIAKMRLDAIPYALYCMDCKKELEQEEHRGEK